MRKKLKWILTAVILIVAGGIGMYNLWDRTPSGDLPEEEAVPVQRGGGPLNVNAMVVKGQLMTDDIYATGSLLPDEEVELSFETSGKIVAINFTEGTAVKKGDLLAKVNDETLQAQLSKYMSQLKLAEDRVYRQNTLLAKDAVSQEAYEQAQTELAMLKADIELVEANIRLTELRAPFDGIIGLRNISEGAYASPNSVVAKLTKRAPIKIEFYVPERYSNQIRKGTPLTFAVEGVLKSFPAVVYAVESQVENDTRKFPVRAIYPNTNNELMPGRYVNVRIRMAEIPDAIAVPSEALVPELGIDKVFLYKDGKAQPVAVETGLRTDAMVQVVKGLQMGDTVITSGTLQLRTDLPVKLDRID